MSEAQFRPWTKLVYAKKARKVNTMNISTRLLSPNEIVRRAFSRSARWRIAQAVHTQLTVLVWCGNIDYRARVPDLGVKVIVSNNSR